MVAVLLREDVDHLDVLAELERARNVEEFDCHCRLSFRLALGLFGPRRRGRDDEAEA
jgi:hypothetical protein